MSLSIARMVVAFLSALIVAAFAQLALAAEVEYHPCNPSGDSRTCFEILQVTPDVSAQGLKAAYRKMVMQYHPDRNAGSPIAEAEFKLIQLAYSTLSDPNLRSSYQSQHLEVEVDSQAAQGLLRDLDILAKANPGADPAILMRESFLRLNSRFPVTASTNFTKNRLYFLGLKKMVEQYAWAQPSGALLVQAGFYVMIKWGEDSGLKLVQSVVDNWRQLAKTVVDREARRQLLVMIVMSDELIMSLRPKNTPEAKACGHYLIH